MMQAADANTRAVRPGMQVLKLFGKTGRRYRSLLKFLEEGLTELRFTV